MKCDEVMQTMFSQRCLSLAEYDKLRSLATNTDRNEHLLLQIVLRGSKHTFITFKNALDECQEHLGSLLLEESSSKEAATKSALPGASASTDCMTSRRSALTSRRETVTNYALQTAASCSAVSQQLALARITENERHDTGSNLVTHSATSRRLGNFRYKTWTASTVVSCSSMESVHVVDAGKTEQL